jgi:hypothetical protein
MSFALHRHGSGGLKLNFSAAKLTTVGCSSFFSARWRNMLDRDSVGCVISYIALRSEFLIFIAVATGISKALKTNMGKYRASIF